MTSYRKSFRMGAPFIMAIGFLVIACFNPPFTELREIIKSLVSFFPDISTPIINTIIDYVPLEKIPPNPVIFIAFAIGCLVFYPLGDHSSVIPNKMNLSVFFSEEELNKRIEALPDFVLEEYPIQKNWTRERSEFFERMDLMIEEEENDYLGVSNTEYLGGSGNVSFEISKVGYSQKYHMSNGKGTLKLSVGDADSTATMSFKLLEKLESSFFHIDPFELLCKWSFYIFPEYDQTYLPGPTKSARKFETLTTITKVSIFPLIAVGETLYLKRGEGRNFVPIGYCKYSPKI